MSFMVTLNSFRAWAQNLLYSNYSRYSTVESTLNLPEKNIQIPRKDVIVPFNAKSPDKQEIKALIDEKEIITEDAHVTVKLHSLAIAVIQAIHEDKNDLNVMVSHADQKYSINLKLTDGLAYILQTIAPNGQVNNGSPHTHSSSGDAKQVYDLCNAVFTYIQEKESLFKKRLAGLFLFSFSAALLIIFNTWLMQALSFTWAMLIGSTAFGLLLIFGTAFLTDITEKNFKCSLPLTFLWMGTMGTLMVHHVGVPIGLSIVVGGIYGFALMVLLSIFTLACVAFREQQKATNCVFK